MTHCISYELLYDDYFNHKKLQRNIWSHIFRDVTNTCEIPWKSVKWFIVKHAHTSDPSDTSEKNYPSTLFVNTLATQQAPPGIIRPTNNVFNFNYNGQGGYKGLLCVEYTVYSNPSLPSPLPRVAQECHSPWISQPGVINLVFVSVLEQFIGQHHSLCPTVHFLKRLLSQEPKDTVARPGAVETRLR